MTQLVHELIYEAAGRDPQATALHYAGTDTSYGALAAMVEAAAAGLRALGAGSQERVAVYLTKREEAVCALFGAAAAGCAFVPIDPARPPAHALALIRDSGARVLVTTAERMGMLGRDLAQCPALRQVVVCGSPGPQPAGIEVVHWDALLRAGAGRAAPDSVDDDMAALLYTQGANKPAALVLSHRNLVAGARALQRCLRIGAGDRLLAALPLSLDAGLHQLTTAFAAGACAVLANPASARDVMHLAEDNAVTILTALPPLWDELAGMAWPRASLRLAVNAGGTLDPATVTALRRQLPRARLVLLYGQPEALRATCLFQEEFDRHGDSIGHPLPHAGVMVLRTDGSQCAPGEPGELVQRGPLVARGYWMDSARTRDSFRPLPPRLGLGLRETAHWSGETVSADEEGYLYLDRQGEHVIVTAGYKVRAAEIEAVLHATGLVEEAVAVGVAHPVLGQVIAVLVRARSGATLDSARVLAACRARLPEHMLPAMVDVRRAPLPRGRNGQIDRALLAAGLAPLFAEVTA
jgi:acyl-CoA synthetase (AMP-forming)/AMP-acid ligase II